MMPEEGKTDSESSCSFFGKRKVVTRKNALCLRRKRTRKAVVSSSKKEKRLPERMHCVCGENGLGKQLFLLRKKKSGYPKECIMLAEKTDSESSCPFFEKRKAVIRKNEFCLQKIRLETPRRRRPFLPFGHFSRFIREICIQPAVRKLF